MTDITALHGQYLIPPEALEAAAISLMGKLMVSNEDAQHLWDKLYEPEKNRFRREAIAALRAGIAAWPGVWHIRAVDFEGKVILPLPQENK